MNPRNIGKSFDGIFNRFTGGGSRKQKLPPVASPAPTPESVQEGAASLGEQERVLAKRRKGRRSTILTEGSLGGAPVDRQSLLGNTGA
jgi:hypothetical protein